MIKYILVAFFSLVGSSAVSQSQSLCYDASEIVVVVAEGRDKGISIETAYLVMVNNGLDSQTALDLLEAVYVVGRELPPDTLGYVFLQTCLGEGI